MGMARGEVCLLATPTGSCFDYKKGCYFHRSAYELYHVIFINEISVNNPYMSQQTEQICTAGGQRLIKKTTSRADF